MVDVAAAVWHAARVWCRVRPGLEGEKEEGGTSGHWSSAWECLKGIYYILISGCVREVSACTDPVNTNLVIGAARISCFITVRVRTMRSRKGRSGATQLMTSPIIQSRNSLGPAGSSSPTSTYVYDIGRKGGYQVRQEIVNELIMNSKQ